MFDSANSWGLAGLTRTQRSAQARQRLTDECGCIFPSREGSCGLSTDVDKRRQRREIALSRR